MEVDFLEGKEWKLLFGSVEKEAPRRGTASKEPVGDASPSPSNSQQQRNRPSLHPLAIEAIEESFRLRAQNSTTSPLRFIDSSTELYEVEYAAMKFADRFLQKHSKKPTADGFSWTDEELHTIGGRIVGVIMVSGCDAVSCTEILIRCSLKQLGFTISISQQRGWMI
jgi:hypothetical protein